MSKAREVLIRLKRRLGRERGRYVRIYNAHAGEAFSPGRDRAWYEITICNIAIGFVDEEIRKLGRKP